MSKIKHISFENLSTFAEAMKDKYAQKTDLADFQTEAQVTAAINAKIASTYKAGGSAAFADLPELTEANLGLVVNVTDAFTTTADFIEGAGAKHPAGTNVVVAQSGEEFKYDVLAGFVDLSGYETTEAVNAKLDSCVKTEDFETVTEAEILALFAGGGE